MATFRKDGVTMVWHYNAFLTYDVKPAEETRVLLDEATANNTQVDVNAFFLENGKPTENDVIEKSKLTESLYANALALWDEPEEKEKVVLDRRA